MIEQLLEEWNEIQRDRPVLNNKGIVTSFAQREFEISDALWAAGYRGNLMTRNGEFPISIIRRNRQNLLKELAERDF